MFLNILVLKTLFTGIFSEDGSSLFKFLHLGSLVLAKQLDDKGNIINISGTELDGRLKE